ncbi:hypothetical protein JYK14_01185 [Siccirubricoccus sp. KC 17139]|uniref:DUF6876 domain-containing protein n=1 Tax=Siccirubricoccus soli TaxID=2899147 RepID=A0ABT1D0L1_9PROT|nr:DUF6876 family protein [Siccirubricoccus soli]MCO6414794.1 hypothetical protein [Siccirubricoccus soli]MCP2680924.1 hypothetical protein [Siccirubricoccus soli]
MDRQTFENTLSHFRGSETFTRHGLRRDILMTEGVTWLTQNGCAWLVDAVASCQTKPHIRAEPFQHWQLHVDLATKTCVLTMDDGNGRELVKQLILYTDCLVPKLRLYLVEQGAEQVCMLTQEY